MTDNTNPYCKRRNRGKTTCVDFIGLSLVRLELGEGRLEAVGHLLHHFKSPGLEERLHDTRLGGEDGPENLVGEFTAFRGKVYVLLFVAAWEKFDESVLYAFADNGVKRSARKFPVIAYLPLRIRLAIRNGVEQDEQVPLDAERPHRIDVQ